MSYNKTLVSRKQEAMIKSITDLLEVLSEIELDNTSGNDAEIVLDDGSVMTLNATTDKGRNFLFIEKISITNARLNLDIVVSRTRPTVTNYDKTVIGLVKEKPDTIRLVLKKKK